MEQNNNKEQNKTPIDSNNKSIRNETITILVIVFGIFFAIGIFAYVLISNSTNNSKLRNMATEEMSTDYTNVYADIVRMEPMYVKKEVGTISATPYSELVICQCTTVEGKIVWISIPNELYPGAKYENIGVYEPCIYDSSNPARVTGKIYTAKEIMDELEQKIGNQFILRSDKAPSSK